MLTYQLQPRQIKFRGEAPPFPSEAVVELTLEPGHLFGGSEGPSRVLVLGSDRRIEFNANTGRFSSTSKPPLAPVDVKLKWKDASLSLRGNSLTYSFVSQDLADLQNTVAAFHYFTPIALTAALPDPVYVVRSSGRLGDVEFGWEHAQGGAAILVANQELIETRLGEALQLLDQLTTSDNPRLAAAFHYFHAAKRLWAVAVSAWEFAAETILNYAKVLEILFGQTREDVRTGLASVPELGQELVERVFVPVLLLRSHLDVAHPRVARVDLRRRLKLYEFVEALENHFEILLKAASAAVLAGTLTLAPTGELEIDADEQAALDRFLAE